LLLSLSLFFFLSQLVFYWSNRNQFAPNYSSSRSQRFPLHSDG
jgi:hypothetical protein